MYEEAISSDSLECLKFAHQQEKKVPLGRTGNTNPKFNASRYYKSKEPAAVSLPVLRYVCEEMNPVFAWEVVLATARRLADRTSTGTLPHDQVDWRMVSYLEGRLGRLRGRIPRAVRALAAGRRERAVAFAFVLFRAGKLADKCPRHPSAALWSAMGMLPSDCGCGSPPRRSSSNQM
jgi:hypothetical protein